ncbi:hypothetical protein M3644_30290 [Bacillus cereus]|uniref:hypothetical protein n=1 Tax=Bacillus cereus TaxID=1396 RepID=UPI00203CED63|nr:hypothetical protein [Bacillus cereus]MCM3224021.1 hypothetical protein [Bacillus cereus]
MTEILYTILILYIGITIGTCAKISSYGLSKRFTLFLSIITPFILTSSHFKNSYKLLKKKEYKKSLLHIKHLIVGYPLCVRLISEIAVESLARDIAIERIQREKHIETKKDTNILEKISTEFDLITKIREIFNDFLNNNKKKFEYKYIR